MSQFEPHEMLCHLLRGDFASFLRASFETLNPGTRYRENWHHAAMCHALEEVRLGRCKRLIICLPPRALKSITATVAFPAFLHGHDPSARVIAVSYAQDLAIKLHNDYRSLVTSAWFRDIFPNTRISSRKDTEVDTETTAFGGRLSTSIGGVLTGRGADYIIIDDPLKPIDAGSEAKRSQVNTWYGSTLASRLDDKNEGAIIIVTQRIHVDDLVGYLMRRGGEEWTVLNLPAIATQHEAIPIGPGRVFKRAPGDLLQPDREDHDALARLRLDLGSEAFEAQYQQSPTPVEGAMFKRAWFRRFDAPPEREEDDVMLQSWDTASKTGPANDWSVCATLMCREGLYYLIDVWRGKLDFPSLKKQAIDHARAFGADMVLVEDTGIGTGLISELQMAGIDTVGMTPKMSKEARASIQSARIEGGRVLLPNTASWLEEFEAEVFAFPGSRHDDQVDAMTQALAYEIPEPGGVFYIDLFEPGPPRRDPWRNCPCW